MTQDYCAICGRLVDKSLDQYDPMSAQVDHIIPIAKGGHPSAIDNLQLTHRICNAKKSDKLQVNIKQPVQEDPLKWSLNWTEYRG